MVDFAGYSLPVQYAAGIKESHLHVRQSCGMQHYRRYIRSTIPPGLFDVSHMGQIRLHGRDRVQFLESLTVADVQSLKPMASSLSVFTTSSGGIIDDTIITNLDTSLGLVINGACKHKDIAHIRKHIEQASSLDVQLEVLEGQSLVALQGPKSMEVLTAISDVDLTKMAFMTTASGKVAGKDCLISRCGYTGEDGFELSVRDEDVVEVASALCAHDAVEPAGLGARDSLRLEAGLCLYGNDIDDTTSPIEAGLAWTISKRRRAEGGFPGESVILDQIQNGVSRRRVGFVVTKGPPARGHEVVLNADGEEIGKVTSGTYSPCLSKPIGMAYINKGHAKAGTEIHLQVRKKQIPAVVSKMPWVTCHYYKPTL